VYDTSVLDCRVGTISSLASRDSSLHQIICLTPAHAPGRVPVDIAANQVDFTAAELMYTYRQTVSVLSVYPAASPVSGGTVVRWCS
jgi:hypothetical protein